MSNRYLKQFSYQLEQDLVKLYATATIGASGAVSRARGAGITSITKSSTAGQYVVTMADPYNRFIHFTATMVAAGPTTASTVQVLMNPATIQATIKSTRQITIQCLDAAGAAVNPASGEQISLQITMRNSSIAPND